MELKPQLATDSKVKPPKVPEGPGWIIEPKLDGWRFMWKRTADGIECVGGRNGVDHTHDEGIDEIKRVLMDLPVGTVLDSELVATGGQDASISSALSGTPRGRGVHLAAWVFDVLEDGQEDVCHLPWTDRRARLDRLAEKVFDGTHVVPVPYLDPPSQEVHELWMDESELIEGSVAKRKTSRYKRGRRSTEWIKIKPQETTEAKVIGYEMGKGASNGHVVGALKIRLLETGAETSIGWEMTVEEAEAAIGKHVEIRHHGWFKKSGTVKHPVGYRWRPDRDQVKEAA